jgi:hypothetical protein
VARLAIAKGFLGEYAKQDKDVRPTAEPAGQNPQLPFAAWRTFQVVAVIGVEHVSDRDPRFATPGRRPCLAQSRSQGASSPILA